MKRITSFIWLSLMVPHFAFASREDELKSLIDDLGYSITVEWDQRDKKQFEAYNHEFQERFLNLIKKGLTQQEFSNVTGVNLLDIHKMDLNSSEEVVEFIKKNQLRKNGANWKGEKTFILASGIIVGSALLYFIASAINQGIQTNRRYKECVRQNNGNEEPCVDNEWVLYGK